jgi:hypothetical protein
MSLLKNIGFLSDEHTRFYIAETALAIHSLHKAVRQKLERVTRFSLIDTFLCLFLGNHSSRYQTRQSPCLQ